MGLTVFEEQMLQNIETSLKSLRIADLELFISAAHFKSLGKSAQFHNLSQSAASAAIKRVEEAFGIPLCTHEKRHFRLTVEGARLFPRMENWVRELRDMIVSKKEIPMRLVTTHAIAQVAVPPLLSEDHIEFTHLRPDDAYAAILRDEADIALVLDNAPWKGVAMAEVGSGYFQLYSRQKEAPMGPVLLPEEQMEVLALQQSWREVHGYSLPIQSRIPSWSLIANICAETDAIGFLPDFLGKKHHLHPVLWQPAPSSYRLLAIYRPSGKEMQERFNHLILKLKKIV